MTYRSSAIAKSSVNVSSLVVTAPAGVATNDVVVGGCTRDGGTGTITLPTGFTQLASSPLASTLDGEIGAAGYKVESGTPPANYTFTFSVANDCVAALSAHSSIDNATPLNQSSGAANSSSNASPMNVNATGFTTTQTCDLIYLCMPDWNTSGTARSYTAPTGFTLRQSDASTNFSTMALCTRDAVAAGATGTITGVATSAGNSGGWMTFLIALYSTVVPAPNITGGTANPVQSSAGNTITGTSFDASKGSNTLVIGGVTQTTTAWSDTSITYTADRGTNLNDVAVNAVVNATGGASNNYALTGFDPPSGYSCVTLTSVWSVASERIQSSADLAIGNQIEWDDVTISIDASGVITWPPGTPDGYTFNARVGVTSDGWGALEVQTFNSASAATGAGVSKLRYTGVSFPQRLQASVSYYDP